MRAFAIIAAILFVVIRLLGSSMAENDIRGDLALMPSASSAPDMRAENVAEGIKRILKQRECELVPGSMIIDVGEGENVPLNVVGGGVSVKSNGPTQRVDLAVSCTRTGPFFFTKTIEVVVHTRGPGDGPASHFPPEAE